MSHTWKISSFYINPAAKYKSRSFIIHTCECTGTGSARATYAERKAELSTVGQIAYDPTSPINLGHVISYVSPRTVRRPMLRVGHASGGSSAVLICLCL